MKIKFLGADETVTGSKHLLIGKDSNILIDCGLYQGTGSKQANKKIELLLKNEKIDAIILTHAHLDHSGYLPKIYKDGFRGPIFTTVQTKNIAEVILKDNAHIQQENKKKLLKSNQKHLIEAEILYSETEVSQVLSNFMIKNFNEPFTFKDFEITLLKAGHILGACSPFIRHENSNVCFSGDLGRSNDLMIPPAQAPIKCQNLVLESTYGNRDHAKQDIISELSSVIRDAIKVNACILIPAFSVGRSQLLMILLDTIFDNDKSLKLPVYIDSPMTIKVTDIHEKNCNLLRVSASKFKSIKDNFTFVQFTNQKKRMNEQTNAHIILTASGMLSGGNILSHLKNKAQNISDILLITGYQSEDTLGHQLLNGERNIKIDDEKVEVKLNIINFPHLSSHMDAHELVKWSKEADPQKVFLTHGEKNSLNSLKADLSLTLNADIIIPKIGEEHSLL
jgi:metallo-beta-lactamase family protein